MKSSSHPRRQGVIIAVFVIFQIILTIHYTARARGRTRAAHAGPEV